MKKQTYGVVTDDGYIVALGQKDYCNSVQNDMKDKDCCYSHTEVYRGLKNIAQSSCYKTVGDLKKAIEHCAF